MIQLKSMLIDSDGSNPELKETGEPIEGIFPDTRRVIRIILEIEEREDGRYLKISAARRSGAKWVKEDDLPEIVVESYDKIRKATSTVTQVGMTGRIYWPLDKTFYSGNIESFNQHNSKFKILYDDGDVEHLDMSKEYWEVESVSHE